MSDYPIDIVVPWVDGSDPVWQKEHAKYAPEASGDNNPSRFREWGLLRYWFRGLEEYAPWVRTVHFVTFGHLPPWLNLEHPKLHIVKHSDYIPDKYLPTFSSIPIELNFHRIPGLSENFLFFNDDLYFSQPTSPEDFFKNGIPQDTAAFGVIKAVDTVSFLPYIMLNVMGIINEKFSKTEMLKRDFSKWITLKNGRGVLNTLYLLPWKEYTGFRNYHSCIPFQKATFEEVWEQCGDILDKTCMHKFRSREDVNQYLMQYWQLCSGNFEPRKPNNAYYTIGVHSHSTIEAALYHTKYKIVCINDDPTGVDFEKEQAFFAAAMAKKYPRISSYELNQ